MRERDWRQKTKRTAFGKWIAAGAFLCLARAETASVTITGPAALQADIISVATNTYSATITPSTFFAGSYTVNLISKKPSVPVGPSACTLDDSIKAIVEVTTKSYVYGYANGMQYERNTDLTTIGNMAVVCSTDTSCAQALGDASTAIFDQNFSTPTVIAVP